MLAACAFAGAAMPASAQDIEPRAYSNTPVGVNFLIVGYAYTRGGLAPDSSSPITNPDLTTSSAVVAYARSPSRSASSHSPAAGNVSATATYDAFGVTLTSSGGTPSVYLYASEQLEPNLGFYYLRARHYQQGTGRFVSTDPELGGIFEPVTLHRYLYAGANPVDNADPSGRNFTLPSVTITQAIIGTVGAGFLTTVGTRALGIAKDWQTAVNYGVIASSLVAVVLAPAVDVTTEVAIVAPRIIQGIQALGRLIYHTVGQASRPLVAAEFEAAMATAERWIVNRVITAVPTVIAARCPVVGALQLATAALFTVGTGLPAGPQFPGFYAANPAAFEPYLRNLEIIFARARAALSCPG